LGHEVSALGAKPLRSPVKALQQRPPLTNLKQLLAFLGLVNFYHRFVRSAAALLKPLTDRLRSSKGGKEPIDHTPEFLAAIASAKQAVADAVLLAHLINGAELCPMVNASDVHLGASLQQRTSSSVQWQPLGFFAKKLELAQQRYASFDRELWACFAGIHHFHFMLEGRRFAIYTDHKPLAYALRRTSDPWTARQCRQLAYITEFTSDLRHIAEASNIGANTLSRLPATVTVGPQRAALKPVGIKAPSGSPAAAAAAPVPLVAAITLPDVSLDYRAISASQQSCPAIAKLAAHPLLHVQPFLMGENALLCNWSMSRPCPLVPDNNRRAVFDAVHGLAHPRTRATRRLVSARAVWSGMKADIGQWCRDCQQCSLRQGIQPSRPRHPADTGSSTTFQPHPCGFSGTSTNVSGGWFYLLIHSHRSLFQMAGSYSLEVHGRRLLCGRLGDNLDCSVWSTHNYNLRPRDAVLLGVVV
jgi:hypothetical protein